MNKFNLYKYALYDYRLIKQKKVLQTKNTRKLNEFMYRVSTKGKKRVF